MVNGAVDAICVRNTCIDANNTRAMRSDTRNDVAFEAPKQIICLKNNDSLRHTHVGSDVARRLKIDLETKIIVD